MFLNNDNRHYVLYSKENYKTAHVKCMLYGGQLIGEEAIHSKKLPDTSKLTGKLPFYFFFLSVLLKSLSVIILIDIYN